jgi:hypothetical protein
VFLLPGCLQCDLSFTPASQFGATGPKFELLFGSAVKRPFGTPRPIRDIFGYAVHHALRARFCIERIRYWQAEYWISSLRDEALNLACRCHGCLDYQGRGYDDLPQDVLENFKGGLVRTLERNELLRALRSTIDALMRETEEVQGLAEEVSPELKKLTEAWDCQS